MKTIYIYHKGIRYFAFLSFKKLLHPETHFIQKKIPEKKYQYYLKLREKFWEMQTELEKFIDEE